VKKRKKTMVGLVCALAFGISAFGIPSKVVIQPGDIEVLDFGSALTYVQPSSKAIDVIDQGAGRLRITGSKPGSYSLSYILVDGSKGKVDVLVSGQGNYELKGAQLWLERELEDMIGIDDIAINPYLDMVEIRGAIVAFSDWYEFRRILVLANKRWEGKISSSVKFDPNLAPLNQRLKEMLSANIGISDPSVSVVQDMGNIKVILSGSAFSDTDRKLAEEMVVGTLARIGLPDATIINQIRKSNALVEVEFTYFRLSDKIADELGMDILNEINMGLIAGADWANNSKPSYSAAFRLDMDKVFQMLSSSGLASVSRKQTITVENGKKGSSKFGGEQIIRPRVTSSGTRADVTKIPFGFIIEVTPSLRGKDNVRLEIDIENSNVEFDAESSDYTKMSSNAKSVLDVPINGMAVLSVNRSREAADGNSGTPFLRKVPGVNFFFGKKRKEKLDWYSGFIVVPRIPGRISETTERSVSERTDAVLERIEKKLNAG